MGTWARVSSAVLERYFGPRSTVSSSGWTGYGAGASLWARVNDLADDAAASDMAAVTDGDGSSALCFGVADNLLALGLAGTLGADDTVVSLAARVWAQNQNEVGQPAFVLNIAVASSAPGSGYVTQHWLAAEPGYALGTAGDPTFTTDPATDLAWTPASANAARVYLRGQDEFVDPLSVSTVEVKARFTPGLPTGTFTATVSAGQSVGVDASDVAPADGWEIIGYSWDWGDGTPDGSGMLSAHTYSVGGDYTITLTVTYAGGETFTIEEDIVMATITRVTPKKATRGASGTTITLTGTSLGSTQDTSTLTVGGKAVTVGTWSATSITFTLASDTPYGAQDLVLTIGGTALTVADAVYVYDATDNKDTTDVVYRRASQVYLDGIHVGLTGEDGVSVRQMRTRRSFTADDAETPAIIDQKVSGCEVTVRFAQLFKNGTLLASVLGGTYDATAKEATIMGETEESEHSLMVVDSNGIAEYWPRVMVSGDIQYEINKNFGTIPVKFEAMATSTEVLHRIDISAVA